MRTLQGQGHKNLVLITLLDFQSLLYLFVTFGLLLGLFFIIYITLKVGRMKATSTPFIKYWGATPCPKILMPLVKA